MQVESSEMQISHILQETGRSINRNRTAFFLATSVQAVCLTLLSIFLVLTFNLGAVVHSASKNIQLNVFLSPDADTQSLQGRIRRVTGVADTRLVTKEEALAELRTEMDKDAEVIDALGTNPLPASIRVSLLPGYASPAALASLEKKVGLLPGVTEVWSGRESLSKLDQILRTAIGIGIAILVIVSLSVIFIVFQTVDSSIVTRSSEIEIMELVGASRSTVQVPFILEGTLQGFLGGIIAFILVFILGRIISFVLPAPIFPFGSLLAIDLVLGGLLGFLGSVIALNRIRR